MTQKIWVCLHQVVEDSAVVKVVDTEKKAVVWRDNANIDDAVNGNEFANNYYEEHEVE